ncbi:uncharacterized protein B0I36DRAFT_258208 [Microdochium trichocladiopsis]|uniref:Plasma membrane fusion protein PRM1 n=1 Tax=Microdochium trichocladiopsis TaxID=1682393 RepID=A0A9P8XSA5_9PEZI|nr:uncharacterized protein B0I36DRAFT_258208 [Microdochium trichocladiopsis]KAH7009122.1 hypothetical protein B0I36DRAFT_258208 [Microdochium trichocladiopsis]
MDSNSRPSRERTDVHNQHAFIHIALATILVLAYLIPLSVSIEKSIDEAQDRASVACLKAEAVGSTVVSMPHYLSQGINSLTADGVTNSVRAIASSLDLVLEAMEKLLLFVFHSMTDTYMCLLLMAIHGGLNITISAMEEFRSLYQGATTGSLQSIEQSIATTNKGIDSVNAFISQGANTDVQQLPHLNVDDALESIRNTKIDIGPILNDLNELERRIPDFATVKNMTDMVLTTPFRAVRTELNQTLGSWAFDPKELFVPEKESFVFCPNDTTFSDVFKKQRDQVRLKITWSIVIIICLAVLLAASLYYIQSRNLELVQVLVESPRMKQAQARLAPLASILTKFRISRRHCSSNASALLLIGFSGLLSCLIATLFLRTVESEALEMRDAIEIRAEALSTSMQRISTAWADTADSAMGRLNEDLTGQLQDQMHRATDGVNSTITTFNLQIQQALTAAFGDSILRDAIQQALRCLIGTKIDAVQTGLRWVNEHVNIDFPPLPHDVFSIGASIAETGLDKALSSGSDIIMDNIDSAIMYVADKVRRDISTHAIISAVLILVYLMLLLVDVVVSRRTGALKTNDKEMSEFSEKPLPQQPQQPVTPSWI